jgi:hypothetical protein
VCGSDLLAILILGAFCFSLLHRTTPTRPVSAPVHPDSHDFQSPASQRFSACRQGPAGAERLAMTAKESAPAHVASLLVIPLPCLQVLCPRNETEKGRRRQLGRRLPHGSTGPQNKSQGPNPCSSCLGGAAFAPNSLACSLKVPLLASWRPPESRGGGRICVPSELNLTYGSNVSDGNRLCKQD